MPLPPQFQVSTPIHNTVMLLKFHSMELKVMGKKTNKPNNKMKQKKNTSDVNLDWTWP